MKLVAGLGNPGPRYRRNRHNVGFQIVDQLAAELGTSFDQTQQRADVARTMLNSEKIILAKPHTFMNDSGAAVGALMRFYKLEPSDLLVVFDDLDLPLGRIRLRAEGGHGGHNGMRSIAQHLGANTFPRLRVGIGRPPGRMDPAAYVLQDFSVQDEEIMNQTRAQAVKAILTWIKQGIVVAMNEFNIPPADEPERSDASKAKDEGQKVI